MARRRLVIPRAATLRGRKHRIHLHATTEMKRDRVVGQWDLDDDTAVIRLDPDQPPSELDTTWCHEVLHAIWPKGVVDADTEEKLVKGLEYRLRDAVARGVLKAE
jgi:hypothetical protein